jgi:DNA-directed RNA polymerase subunit RPC12/RpoP
MLFISPELKKLCVVTKETYTTGHKVAMFKCVVCGHPLTLDEKGRGNRCIECMKLLKK